MTGHTHPLTQLLDRLSAHFRSQGFEIAFGPEAEEERYNFDLLNIPPNHPARDEHDTFYLAGGKVLRTHTSPMQLRYVQEHPPPLRVIIPGRCFRNEATDATHNTTFHQLEGLVIEPGVTMRHLIGTLETMLKAVFQEQLQFRVRPSYFPFVEPGIEIDIKMMGADRWLEIIGAGMVHPSVIKNMGLDPVEHQGFAFAVGLERLLNLLTDTDDVRWSLSGDYRFLGQF